MSTTQEAITKITKFHEYLGSIISDPYNHKPARLQSIINLIDTYYEEYDTPTSNFYYSGAYSDWQPYTSDVDDYNDNDADGDETVNAEESDDDDSPNTNNDVNSPDNDDDLQNNDDDDSPNTNDYNNSDIEYIDGDTSYESDNEDMNCAGFWDDDASDSDVKSSESTEESDNEDYYWKLYQQQNHTKSEVETSNERVKLFMNSKCDTDNILLYEKQPNIVSRSNKYIDGITSY